MDLLSELDWRGLYADCTDRDALSARLASGPTVLYCGFDPTADSLHVGNLVPLLALRRFQQAGHRPIALAGGATGMIGDPSGKSVERNLQSRDQVQANIASIKSQLTRFLDFDAPSNPALLVDNADWTAPVTYLEFLRDIGKHFSVNAMVAKESVRSRMEDREVGISYTEFSYMLLQAFDFHHLRQHHHCELQVGATDQWGNITAGIDLCRRKLGVTVWGLTFPLLTKSDGTKYGKTASGTVWLDPRRTSPYRFYQFFVQAEDVDVIRLLKCLTFLSADAIAELERQLAAQPGARLAQKRLAAEMTTLVHGPTECDHAIRASEILFGGNLDGIPESVLNDVIGEVPTREIPRSILDGTGMPLTELAVQSGLSTSKGQARKDLEGGGLYLNNTRETSVQRHVTHADLLFGKHLLLRKGKRTYAVVTAR
ncbi:MAG: tyrosine--tRNA ligase [Verrucomicrobiae bacterium]|nr:tyrosine--tRNA ligase [Verrucomicrobiae bacterium]